MNPNSLDGCQLGGLAGQRCTSAIHVQPAQLDFLLDYSFRSAELTIVIVEFLLHSRISQVSSSSLPKSNLIDRERDNTEWNRHIPRDSRERQIHMETYGAKGIRARCELVSAVTLGKMD